MSSRWLTKWLLIAALYPASHTAALASPCGDAARNYNRIAKSHDDWYVDAFEKAAGTPASAHVTTVYCSKLLPVYRERLRRQKAVMEAYRAWQSACVNPRENYPEIDGLKSVSPPVVERTMVASVQMCERALKLNGHVDNAARLDVGPRTCGNQRDRCVSYRNQYGPVGSGGICSRVFRVCLKTGVWDATTAFPYGGVRITGMTRQ
jgi:hypothetical protein